MIILIFSVGAKWCVMPALWLLHHPRQTGLMFPAAPPTHLSSPALKHWPLKFLPGSQMEKSRLVTGASYAEVNPKCLSLVSRRFFPEPFYFLCKGAFLASSPPATSKALS